jgi:hypothetical protein
MSIIIPMSDIKKESQVKILGNINIVKSKLLEVAKIYNSTIKIEFDINPKVSSIKTKIIQHL